MSDPVLTRLVESLGRHAEAAPRGTDLVPDTLRRARRMRTRRRIGAMCVAAVLVGGAVPLGAELVTRPGPLQVATHGGATPSPRTGPGTSSPDTPEPDTPPTPGRATVTPRRSGGTVDIDLAALPAGPRPETPWYEAGAIHARGRRIPLDPAVRPAAVTPVGRNFVVLDQGADGSRSRLLLVDRSGRTRVLSKGPVNPPVVVSADPVGEFAWAERVGDRTRLVLASSKDGTVLDTVDRPGDLVPAGFVQGMVALSQESPRQSAQIWIAGRGVATVPGALGATATDAARGLAAVTTRVEPDPATGADRACSAVIDAANDYGRRWSSCRVVPVSFSPDGRFVFAVDSRTEGLGPSRAFVLGARSGRVLLRLHVENTTQRVAWGRRGTVLFDAWTGGQMGVVRCTTGGDCELARGPARSVDPTDPRLPYVLAERP